MTLEAGRLLSITHRLSDWPECRIEMPRLLVADAIEAKRAHFLEARDGRAGIGPFDRSRVRHWLAAMERQFAGIRTWLP